MFKSRQPYPMITNMYPSSPMQEAYRKLRTNLNYTLSNRQMKTIMIASAQKDEGKSMTIANLGAAFAMEDKSVVLIDADLRRPSLHLLLGRSNRIGLTHLLEQSCSLTEAIRETDIPNLSVITSGGTPIFSTELLSSKRMSTIIDELKDRYDLILIDSPPALLTTDAQVIAGNCDGIIIVVRKGKVKSRFASKMKADFDATGIPILGAIINDIDRQDESFPVGYGTYH